MLPLPAIITIIAMIVVIVALVGWDLVVIFGNKIGNDVDTISGRMRIWGKTILFFPWAWAVLFGHWFAPKAYLAPSKITLPILGVLTVAITAFSLIFKNADTVTSWPLFFIILNLGALAGAMLWPQ